MEKNWLMNTIIISKSQLKMGGFQTIQRNLGRWDSFQEPMLPAGDRPEKDGEKMLLVSWKPLRLLLPIWVLQQCILIMYCRSRITMKDMTST